MTASERTPLLSEQQNAPSSGGAAATSPSEASPSDSTVSKSRGAFSPFVRLCLTCFMLAIAFVYTATPLIFSFRTITCENLYNSGALPPYTGTGDRCANPEVESQTAADISLMVTFTTIAGVLNLMTTGWYIKKFGVRVALVMQTLWPCLRNMCQIWSVIHGGPIAITVLQWTQLITIFGGGAGYFLTANTYVAALVAPEERTASFGIVQGTAMAGTAIGYIVGGITGDVFGPPAPFEVTLILLILSTILSGFFLPYIPPTGDAASAKGDSKDAKSTGGGVWGFLAPLKVFLPRVVSTDSVTGKKSRYLGLTFLGLGTFLGVLALAYVPLLLQLTATNTYGFKPTQNGYLLSANATVRALFLTLLFPKIIASGRKWYTSRRAAATPAPESHATEGLETSADTFEPPSVTGEAQEPVLPPEPTDQDHGSRFDLVFVRCSMVLDGLLTGLMLFASQGWHMYLAGVVIPFASGTAPAGKGVLLDMVSKEEQPDALAAIALVEMLATVSTVSLFGMLFAYLSEKGLAGWTFAFNAGLAFIAAGILCFASFPRKARSNAV